MGGWYGGGSGGWQERVVPELPDITVYVEALERRIVGRRLEAVNIRSPFLVRSVEVEPREAEGRVVEGVSRLGKRVVLRMDGELFLVIHLMIAGRLLWKKAGAKAGGKIDLAAFGFDNGTLVLTEAGTTKRASLHVVAGAAGLREHDPGGVDPLTCSAAEFAAVLRRENRTLKRALTMPMNFSGIGNAYSDEILHAAKLSPLKLTRSLTDEEASRLADATRTTLERWTNELRREFGLDGGGPGRFPGVGEITALRPDFAVHGKFGQPCPVCGKPVQRIMSAENECNYCAMCQTGGKVLADRSLSRLLRDDWPRRIEEWE